MPIGAYLVGEVGGRKSVLMDTSMGQGTTT